MQIIWPISLKQLPAYSQDRDSVIFPVPEECPCCRSSRKLTRHGFYSRFALSKNHVYRINIRRYLCPSCLVTVSLLPWFLLPFFQHVKSTILESLRLSFLGSVLIVPGRQLSAFYRRRFSRNIPAIITALREIGWRAPLPGSEHEKAIKVVDRLFTLPSDTALNDQCCANQILTNFMALSL